MKIDKNAVVALTYELIVDGKIADKCTVERPLSFIQGMGYLLPKFEEAIAGLNAGDKFAFTLSPADGYGEVDPERIIDLPIAAFTDPEGKIRHDLLIEGNYPCQSVRTTGSGNHPESIGRHSESGRKPSYGRQDIEFHR